MTPARLLRHTTAVTALLPFFALAGCAHGYDTNDTRSSVASTPTSVYSNRYDTYPGGVDTTLMGRGDRMAY